MVYGFVKVAAVVPNLKVADCTYNVNQILNLIPKLEEKHVQMAVFPELCITSYTCQDLFHQEVLLKESISGLEKILKFTKTKNILIIIGIPISLDNQLFNCAVILQSGKILGVVPKTYIPGYGEFYEERWFSPSDKALSKDITLCNQKVPFGVDILFEEIEHKKICFGVEICEDLWVTIPPSSYATIAGASIIFNLSASNEIIGKYEYRKSLVNQQSSRCIAAYIYTSSNSDESTTDLVFGGHALISEYGSCLAESERFSIEPQIIYSDIDIEKLNNLRLQNTSFMASNNLRPFRKVYFSINKLDFKNIERFIEPNPFVPFDPSIRDVRCKEIFSIQTSGLFKRLKHTGLKHAVIGISGGLDSTLALLVTVKVFDILNITRKNIIAITMPGFGTTGTTYNNSVNLINATGVTFKKIDIKDACIQHFNDIKHDINLHDITYENVQARERTQILMNIANKIGGIVIGTGDMSELALGWCTYNGDHMSMYSVNSGVPKTLVKFLVEWFKNTLASEDIKNILQNIINTPISPELLPPNENGDIDQKTEDIVGPYELHDFFLYHMLKYGANPKKIFFLASLAFKGKYETYEIKKWLGIFLKRFFSQQFKRSCLPDGPKVGTISLSPRGDLRMPSDASFNIWISDLDSIET